jgi:hypothetical protein
MVFLQKYSWKVRMRTMEGALFSGNILEEVWVCNSAMKRPIFISVRGNGTMLVMEEC